MSENRMLVEKPCIDVATLAADTLEYAISSCPRPDGIKPSVGDPDFMEAIAEFVTKWSLEYFRDMTSADLARYIRGLTLLPIDDANIHAITENVARANNMQPLALSRVLLNLFNAMLCNGIVREINNRVIALEESTAAKNSGRLN